MMNLLPNRLCVLVVAAGLVLGACSGPKPPSEAAIQAYAKRKLGAGTTSTGAAPTPAKKAWATRVKLTVEKGEKIPDVDAFLAGDTDPYVIVEYEGARHKTSQVQGSSEPTWGDSFVLDVREGGMLSLTLMDAEVTSDQKIGVAAAPLPPVTVGEKKRFQVKFSDGKRGVVTLVVEGLSR